MTAIAWFRPSSVDDAIDAVRSGGTLVGGGAALASKALAPRIETVAVDLAALAGLDLDVFSPPLIGALVTIEQLATDQRVLAGWPALSQAAGLTANPGVRRVATVGGTVAARLPTADLPTALCAYGAVVHVAWDGSSPSKVPIVDYLASEPDGSIVVAVTLGPAAPGVYRRLAGRPGPAPAIAAVAAVGIGAQVRFWAGAVGHSPRPIDPAALPPEAELLDDDRAAAWYRRRILAVLASDALDALQAHDDRRT